MFNQLGTTLQSGYNDTFGQMSGPQILWTIIGLFVLYQLVVIKWRLIDRNRHDGVPSSFLLGLRRRVWMWGDLRRNKRIMRRGFGTRMQPRTVARTNFDDIGFGNATPAGFTARSSGRADLSKMSPIEAHENRLDLPDQKQIHKSSSQAGLASFHDLSARHITESDEQQEE
jgi:hypothetical protein